MRRPVLLCALLVMPLVAAACGGDDEPTAAASKPAGLVDARTSERLVADFNVADAALIQLDDLPDGWSVDVDEENPELDERLLDCTEPPDRSVAENEQALAERNYELDGASLGSSVALYPDDAYSDAAFDVIRLESFPECYRSTLEDELRREFAASDTPVDVSVQIQRLPDPELGDEAAALRIDVAMTGPGGQAQMVADLLGVRVGRAQTLLYALAVGGPFDPALTDQLLRLSLERLTDE